MSDEVPVIEPVASIDLVANRGPVVNIIVWIFLVLSCLAVIAKILSKINRSSSDGILNRLQLDDGVVFGTLVLAVAQSIEVSRQAEAGLGKPLDSLSASSVRRFYQFELASQLFYVAAIGAAKTAGYIFVLNLQPNPTYRKALYGLLVVLGLWQVASLFAVGFQCPLPRDWSLEENKKCMNQPALWAAVEALNILLDAALVFVLSLIVWGLKLGVPKKIVLSIAFASRLFVIPAIIARVKYMRDSNEMRQAGRFDDNTADPSVAIASAVAMNIAILATCVPFLKPLMDQLMGGWSTSNVRVEGEYATSLAYASELSSRYPPGSVISEGKGPSVGSERA